MKVKARGGMGCFLGCGRALDRSCCNVMIPGVVRVGGEVCGWEAWRVWWIGCRIALAGGRDGRYSGKIGSFPASGRRGERRSSGVRYGIGRERRFAGRRIFECMFGTG